MARLPRRLKVGGKLLNAPDPSPVSDTEPTHGWDGGTTAPVSNLLPDRYSDLPSLITLGRIQSVEVTLCYAVGEMSRGNLEANMIDGDCAGLMRMRDFMSEVRTSRDQFIRYTEMLCSYDNRVWCLASISRTVNSSGIEDYSVAAMQPIDSLSNYLITAEFDQVWPESISDEVR